MRLAGMSYQFFVFFFCFSFLLTTLSCNTSFDPSVNLNNANAGGLAPPKQVRSVIGLFRKDSGASGSDTSLHRMCIDHLPTIPAGRQLDGGRSQSVTQGPEGRDFSKRSHSIAYTGDK